MTDHRSPNVITADAIALISEELDEMRDEVRNMPRGIIAAIGELTSEVRSLRADLTQYQSATNDQISRLRKKAANGTTPAE